MTASWIDKKLISILALILIGILAFGCGTDDSGTNTPGDGDADDLDNNYGDRPVSDRPEIEFDVNNTEEPNTTPGLAVLWGFDDQDGNVAGTGDCNAAGSLEGSGIVQGELGKVGKAISLEGYQQYVDFGAKDCLKLEDGDFTYAVWVYPYPDDTLHAIYGNSRDPFNADSFVGLSLNASVFQFTAKDANDATLKVCAAQNLVSDEDWVHLAVVRKGSDITLYIDGQQETPVDNEEADFTCQGFLGDYTNSEESYQIGHISIPVEVQNGEDVETQIQQHGFTGMMDDFHIFNYALDQEEILEVLSRSATR